MHLKEAMAKSEMKIEIAQGGVARAIWGMTQEYRQVPTGLWSKCSNIDDLLDINSGSLKLMMGVLMQGPPAKMSEDTLKAFNILAQGERVLQAEKPFPETESPEDNWNSSKPKDKWNENGEGGSDVQQTFVDTWFETFGWGKALSSLGKLPKLLGERFSDSDVIMANLHTYLQELERDFTVDTAKLKHITNHFIDELDKGLSVKGGSIPMNPTWVMQQPTGNETGKYLVLDLGGTNLRVFSVELTAEKSGFKVNQVTHKLPKELRTGPAERLWDFVAGHLEEFLKTADFEAGTNTDLSFIFSFPTTQRTIDEGVLQRWTKGFDVADCEGRDVAASLRHAIAKRKLPLKVRVVTNDTTATMMASAYINSETAIGCVFGTGCNGAYFERCQSIPKLDMEGLPAEALMAINCEWGAFDNEHVVLPLTSFDIAIDDASPRKGQQAFEKMVAGLYLGELFRLIMLDAKKRDDTFWEGQSLEKMQEPYFMDSSFLSAIEEFVHHPSLVTFLTNNGSRDTSEDFKISHDLSVLKLGVFPNLQELKFMRSVATLITTRAARLSSTGVAAICLKRNFKTCHVGVEGSLFEKHPHFKRELSRALGDILGWGKSSPGGEDDVEFMLSPGSGVGAAVIASTLTRSRHQI
ncbi:hexokinase [Fusarium denticulatum]|uniref:Phosphotransferase n=1 Tax=Fusarium denticulatum TaxID=48507 RepID=A0A8H5WLN3_9HYPO|nr:hexokinase [Fusarium denticulatum]